MFTIDTMSRQPVYEQIIQQLERLVLSGALKPGDQIPSVRSLSLELSINPNTIQKAYSELDGRGVVYAVPGKGCYISENAPILLCEHKRQELDTLEALASGLAMAGIGYEEVLARILRAYNGGERRDSHD